MRRCILALEIAKANFLLKQPLGVTHVAVEKHAHAKPQIIDQPCVQFADLRHACVGKMPSLLDLLVFDVLDHALDNVADLLHVDGEADDIRPAPAFFFAERLARDFRQVVLDRGIEIVDGVIKFAQLVGELAIILAQHGQQPQQHRLDHVSLVKRLARRI